MEPLAPGDPGRRSPVGETRLSMTSVGRWAGAMTIVALTLAMASGCTNESNESNGTDEGAEVVGVGDAGGEVTDTDGSTVPTDPIEGGSGGQQPDGFSTIQARITGADGEVCEVCLWLADDGDERGRGLMGVTDLGDAVGMAFRFEEATSGSFYMFQTPSPLSIAWFGPDGDHVGSADMAPCLDTPAGDCPLYSPGARYDLAIEVFDGGLEPLGLGPGSSVELIEGSEAERCPLTP